MSHDLPEENGLEESKADQGSRSSFLSALNSSEEGIAEASQESGSRINLYSYTESEIREGTDLGERISSVSHDLDIVEGNRVDFLLERTSKIAEAIEKKTEKKYVILGSMGMYLMLGSIRQDNQRMELLEKRIQGGKNDFDIGFEPGKLDEVMTEFGWEEEAKKLQRGQIGEEAEMVDLMERTELPDFPWQEIEINGKKITVQSPEEMIFEKMSAILNAEQKENKWLIDIKLIKYYLKESRDWDDNQVEEHLKNLWQKYQENVRYKNISEMARKLDEGMSALDVLKNGLSQRGLTGHNVKDELINIFGNECSQEIDELLATRNSEAFSEVMKKLINKKSGKFSTYEEASEAILQEYKTMF